MICRRDLAWLAAGLMLFTVSIAATAAFIVLSVLHHDPPGWTGAPVGLALGWGCMCVIRALVLPRY